MKKARKLISLMTVLCFGMTSVWSHSETFAQAPFLSPVIVAPPDQIFIPSSLGTIETQQRGPSGAPFVVFIQDAHAMADAQKHIQKIITYLQRHYGIKLVALEGAAKNLDATLLRTFPDEFVKKQVLTEYVNRGELTGGEMAAIFSEHEGIYYGIEDWGLYEQNYLAYLEARKNRNAFLAELEKDQNELDEERLKIYNKDLNQFHETVTAFRDKKLGFVEFLTEIASSQKPLLAMTNKDEKYPHLSALFQALENDKKKLDKTIKGSQLFEELQQYLEEKEAALIFNDQERRLSEKYKELFLLKSFANLELTKKQWSEVKIWIPASAGMTNSSDVGSGPSSFVIPRLDRGIQSYTSFYELAEKRDEAFQQNLANVMKETQQQSAIVVAGGFHSQGFQEALKAKNFSYAVITPRIRSFEGEEFYDGVMQGKVSYGSYLRTNFYDAFMRHATLSLINGLNEPDFRKNLKLWRDQLIRSLAKEGRLEEASRYTQSIDVLFKTHREKFGNTNLKSKDEILAMIEGELKNFRNRITQKLWRRFEGGLQEFSDGLDKLTAQRPVSMLGAHLVLMPGNEESDRTFLAAALSHREKAEGRRGDLRSELRTAAINNAYHPQIQLQNGAQIELLLPVQFGGILQIGVTDKPFFNIVYRPDRETGQGYSIDISPEESRVRFPRGAVFKPGREYHFGRGEQMDIVAAERDGEISRFHTSIRFEESEVNSQPVLKVTVKDLLSRNYTWIKGAHLAMPVADYPKNGSLWKLDGPAQKDFSLITAGLFDSNIAGDKSMTTKLAAIGELDNALEKMKKLEEFLDAFKRDVIEKYELLKEEILELREMRNKFPGEKPLDTQLLDQLRYLRDWGFVLIQEKLDKESYDPNGFYYRNLPGRGKYLMDEAHQIVLQLQTIRHSIQASMGENARAEWTAIKSAKQAQRRAAVVFENWIKETDAKLQKLFGRVKKYQIMFELSKGKIGIRIVTPRGNLVHGEPAIQNEDFFKTLRELRRLLDRQWLRDKVTNYFKQQEAKVLMDKLFVGPQPTAEPSRDLFTLIDTLQPASRSEVRTVEGEAKKKFGEFLADWNERYLANKGHLGIEFRDIDVQQGPGSYRDIRALDEVIDLLAGPETLPYGINGKTAYEEASAFLRDVSKMLAEAFQQEDSSIQAINRVKEQYFTHAGFAFQNFVLITEALYRQRFPSAYENEKALPDEDFVMRDEDSLHYDLEVGLKITRQRQIGLRQGLDAGQYFQQYPEKTLRAYEYAAKYKFPASHQIRKALWDNRRFLAERIENLRRWEKPPPRLQILNESFINILKSDQPIAPLLWELYRLQILHALIPELAPVQYLLDTFNIHQFSVGQHTLYNLQMLDDIAAGKFKSLEPVREIFESLRTKEKIKVGEKRREIDPVATLRLSLLLHDLGKGLGYAAAPDHAIISAQKIAPERLASFGLPPEMIRSVSWLVRDHMILNEFVRNRKGDIEENLSFFIENLLADPFLTSDFFDLLFIFSITDRFSVRPFHLESQYELDEGYSNEHLPLYRLKQVYEFLHHPLQTTDRRKILNQWSARAKLKEIEKHRVLKGTIKQKLKERLLRGDFPDYRRQVKSGESLQSTADLEAAIKAKFGQEADFEKLFQRYLAVFPSGYLNALSDSKRLSRLVFLAHLDLLQDRGQQATLLFFDDRYSRVYETQYEIIAAATKDEVGIFSKMAGVMAQHHFNIENAAVETVDDMPVNRFYGFVTQPTAGHDDLKALESQMANTLSAVVSGTKGIQIQPSASESQINGNGLRLNIGTKIEFLSDRIIKDKPASVFRMIKNDQVGLLHTIADYLANGNIAIQGIHAMTHGALVNDLFYINREGQALSPTEKRQVKSDLKHLLSRSEARQPASEASAGGATDGSPQVAEARQEKIETVEALRNLENIEFGKTGITEFRQARKNLLPEQRLVSLTKNEISKSRQIKTAIRESVKSIKRKNEDKQTGPFLPISSPRFIRGLKQMGLQAGGKVLDLGHGEGDAVLQMAGIFGAQTTGIELNDFRYRRSRAARKAAVKAGLIKKDQVHLIKGDFLKGSWKKYDVIYYYSFGGVPETEDMERKLREELKPGGKFVLLGFQESFDKDRNLYQNFSGLLNAGFYLERLPEAGMWVFTRSEARMPAREAGMLEDLMGSDVGKRLHFDQTQKTLSLDGQPLEKLGERSKTQVFGYENGKTQVAFRIGKYGHGEEAIIYRPDFEFLGQKGITPKFLGDGRTDNRHYFMAVEKVVGKHLGQIGELTDDQWQKLFTLLDQMMAEKQIFRRPLPHQFMIGHTMSDLNEKAWLVDVDDTYSLSEEDEFEAWIRQYDAFTSDRDFWQPNGVKKIEEYFQKKIIAGLLRQRAKHGFSIDEIVKAMQAEKLQIDAAAIAKALQVLIGEGRVTHDSALDTYQSLATDPSAGKRSETRVVKADVKVEVAENGAVVITTPQSFQTSDGRTNTKALWGFAKKVLGLRKQFETHRTKIYDTVKYPIVAKNPKALGAGRISASPNPESRRVGRRLADKKLALGEYPIVIIAGPKRKKHKLHAYTQVLGSSPRLLLTESTDKEKAKELLENLEFRHFQALIRHGFFNADTKRGNLVFIDKDHRYHLKLIDFDFVYEIPKTKDEIWKFLTNRDPFGTGAPAISPFEHFLLTLVYQDGSPEDELRVKEAEAFRLKIFGDWNWDPISNAFNEAIYAAEQAPKSQRVETFLRELAAEFQDKSTSQLYKQLLEKFVDFIVKNHRSEIRSEVQGIGRAVDDALRDLANIKIAELKNGDLKTAIEESLERSFGAKTPPVRAAAVFLKDIIAAMDKGEKIIQKSDLLPPVQTEFGEIDLFRLNDVTRYEGYDAAAQLARDLEIAHRLGLITIEKFRGVGPQTQTYKLLRNKDRGVKKIFTSWYDWAVVKAALGRIDAKNFVNYQGGEGQIKFYLQVFVGKARDKHAGNLFTAIASLLPKELNWQKMNLNLGDVIDLRKDLVSKIQDSEWQTTHFENKGQLLYYRDFFGERAVLDMHPTNILSAINSVLDQKIKEQSLREILKWTYIHTTMAEAFAQYGIESLPRSESREQFVQRLDTDLNRIVMDDLRGMSLDKMIDIAGNEYSNRLLNNGLQRYVDDGFVDQTDIDQLAYNILSIIQFGDVPDTGNLISMPELDQPEVRAALQRSIAVMRTAIFDLIRQNKNLKVNLTLDDPDAEIFNVIANSLTVVSQEGLVDALDVMVPKNGFNRNRWKQIPARVTPRNYEGTDLLPALKDLIRMNRLAGSKLMAALFTSQANVSGRELGIFQIVARIQDIPDPEMRELAYLSALYAIIRFLSENPAAQQEMLVKPELLKEFLSRDPRMSVFDLDVLTGNVLLDSARMISNLLTASRTTQRAA